MTEHPIPEPASAGAACLAGTVMVTGPNAARFGRRSVLMRAAQVAAEIAPARGEPELAITECVRAGELAQAVGLPLEAGRIGLLAAEANVKAERL